MAVSIFVCYARKDYRSLDKLKTHLKPLQHQGLINLWYDRAVIAGTEWESEILQHLQNVEVILLLVSPEFMASEYCYGIEMKQAIERHERKEAHVIPIILRPCLWRITSLASLQALPRDGKPIIGPGWRNQDEGFYDVAEGVRRDIEQMASNTLTWPQAAYPRLKPEQ